MNLFAFITSCIQFHIKKVRCELFITLHTLWSCRRRILMNAKQLISENLYFCVFTLRKLPQLTSGVTMQGLPHVVCASQYAGSATRALCTSLYAGSATRTLCITVRWVCHTYSVHHSTLGLPRVHMAVEEHDGCCLTGPKWLCASLNLDLVMYAVTDNWVLLYIWTWHQF